MKHVLGTLAVAHGWLAHVKLINGDPLDAIVGMVLALAIMWIALHVAESKNV